MGLRDCDHSMTTVEVDLKDETRAPKGEIQDEGAEFVIRARSGWVPLDWREMWHFRELLCFLVWRDVKVRYKQTVLGAAWAILQPVFGMVVFTIIFGHFAKMPFDGENYAVFVYAGLLPWTMFANGVTQAGQSLVNQQQLITKVYFPRVFVPAAAFGVALVDMFFAFLVLLGIMAWYQVAVHWQFVLLPVFVALTVVTGLGMGLLLAALTVRYRDFRFVIPFMMQAWMYVSPVIYPVSLVPRQYQWILALNPMAGIIHGYRTAILGTPWDWDALGISLGVGVGLFVLGLYYFKKVERHFADIA
jgi:lipopolysaccharide transport system permease protein